MPSSPEKSELEIGILPLADAAPIVMAHAKGFFAEQGLDVTIRVENSWAGLRDKLAAGMLDAAHMLAPMPLAATLGIDGVGVPMLTAMSLNLNGNGITVSNALYQRLRLNEGDPLSVGAALRRVIESDRQAGAPPLVFAHVFAYSTQHYELRYWLSGCGIDPRHDLKLVVVPPPQMVRQLQEGRIDGFCVGAPWSAVAEKAGLGRTVVNKYQIWNNSPEKVLGVTQEWAMRHPATHRRTIAALIRSARWLDQPEHRAQAAHTLLELNYLRGVSPATLETSMAIRDAAHPRGPGLVFHQGAANFPWISHAQWFLEQMYRWEQLRADLDTAGVASRVYRPDIYREAAKTVGEPYPLADDKPEGLHAQPWSVPGTAGELMLGSDLFFDGAVFDPKRPMIANSRSARALPLSRL